MISFRRSFNCILTLTDETPSESCDGCIPQEKASWKGSINVSAKSLNACSWETHDQLLTLLIAVQPSKVGILYEETLVRLVESGKLSIAAACGCVCHAYTSQKTSLAVTDLHTAAFLCRGLIYWSSPCATSAQRTDGPSPTRQQALYADCGVSLADLIPEVSC